MWLKKGAKIDVVFLNSPGITGDIPSAQIKFFDNGGGMLSEMNSPKPVDDLKGNKGLLNDNKFVSGGVTNSNPVLLIQLLNTINLQQTWRLKLRS